MSSPQHNSTNDSDTRKSLNIIFLKMLNSIGFIGGCFGLEIAAHNKLLPEKYIDSEELTERMAQFGRTEVGKLLELMNQLQEQIEIMAHTDDPN